ncbi:hypothetical protein [Sphingobium sp. Ant17]|uniref:hypothetical protein n=1 Tax=Sphingobium sp. Ant17 TaxID=1461752 RepID=UPI00044614AC|nr:hypothetical protein [Sphingobium sp. Ant17]EXS68113.1 hypothetical protein BF95_01310 [Sphingobium sp. Ant17]
MHVIRTWAALAVLLDTHTDPALKRLLALRRDQLLELGELSDLGSIYLIEPGDSLASIETSIGFPVASNPIDGLRYPDPSFTPAWEWIENHGTLWEAPFVLCDDGSGFILIVPDEPGIDPQLLELIRTFAT